MISLDTTEMCSHLQKKLFDNDGIYHPIWTAMQDDPELTAVVRSRQLHIYRNGRKILVQTITATNGTTISMKSITHKGTLHLKLLQKYKKNMLLL